MSPLSQISQWIEEARAAGMAEPEAMALATSTRNGLPSVRIVLCRGIDEHSIRFFTNYDSRKGRELDANGHAAVVFHWAVLGRQARIEGTVQRVSAAESDAYFASRARGSQVAACVSPQSERIGSIEELRHKQAELATSLHGKPVTRPAHWGGYRLHAFAVEHWTHGADRLHERIRFDRGSPGWETSRLGP